jgi:hypothetical protein
MLRRLLPEECICQTPITREGDLLMVITGSGELERYCSEQCVPAVRRRDGSLIIRHSAIERGAKRKGAPSPLA